MSHGRERRTTSWFVTIAFAVAGVVSSMLISNGLSPRVAVSHAQEEAIECGDYGVAISADWAWKSASDLEASFAMARHVGACRIRIPVSWGDVEKTADLYDWSSADRLVTGAVAAGIEPMLVLYGAPEWVINGEAVKVENAEAGGGGGSSLSSSGGASAPPPTAATVTDRTAIGELFARFAGEAAGRYSDSVLAYEVWNEPNISRFWPNPNAAEYAGLLKLTYPKIHQADPESIVVSAGLAPAADTDTSVAPGTFVREMYRAGAKDYFDVLGVHPYTWRDPVEERLRFLGIEEFEATMNQFGDTEKQMWVTEYGAPTGGLSGLTQSEQADLIAYGIEEARRHPRIDRFYFYTLQDYPLGIEDPESYFGVYTSDGGLKVSAGLLRSLS